MADNIVPHFHNSDGVDVIAIGAGQRHVVQVDRVGVLFARPFDLEGALGNHAERHVLQQRHALGQRNGGVQMEDLELEPAGIGLGAVGPVEVDGERAARFEPFRGLDIAQHLARAERLLIGRRKCRPVALGEPGGAQRIMQRVECLVQAVAPVA